jgi:hypothetical protein
MTTRTLPARPFRAAAALLSLAALVLSAGALAQTPAATGAAAPRLSAVSTLPQYVTGGDVLVRVDVHDPGAAKHLRVERNGVDVTAAFRTMPDGSFLGLVDGLSPGANEIVASANGQGHGAPPGRSATLAVRDNPLSGPLFSGPHQQPFFCTTHQPAVGLGPALDENCSAPTQVSYRYRTTAGTFAVLADPTQRPADLVQTTTLDGRTVDYVVRLERGTLNRGWYELAALHDPAAEPSPFTDEPGWNRRLVYTFGGGCNVGYHQGSGTGGVLNDLFLSQGYAVASASLNVLDNNCSDVISAETALMVKERFVETYGVPRYTIGWGGSGGAIQQHLIADNYPGILDGIVPSLSFPDSLSLATVADCRLFFRYFASPEGIAAGWTAAQRNAASGFGTFGSCQNWHLAFASRLNALEACPANVPAAARYHPATNPTGIRCTSFEQLANQLGRDPATGFVRRPLDNVGVQYGLDAFLAGAISAEQFVSLNEHAGGYDVIGNIVPQRTVADPIGLRRVYETGRIADGSRGLSRTPIIDIRQYTDPASDIHTRFWSFVMRQRLLDANGTAGNHAIFVSSPAGAGAMTIEALAQMDAWLAAIESDSAPGTAAAKVLRNRPVALSDACWTSATTKIAEPFGIPYAGVCEGLFPTWGDTRTAAGAPLRQTTAKCVLQPLDVGDYPVALTPGQEARLQATFPQGVCDWSEPGIEEGPALGTWLDFGS